MALQGEGTIMHPKAERDARVLAYVNISSTPRNKRGSMMSRTGRIAHSMSIACSDSTGSVTSRTLAQSSWVLFESVVRESDSSSW